LRGLRRFRRLREKSEGQRAEGYFSGINDVLVVSCPQFKSQGMKMLREFRGLRRFRRLRPPDG